MKRLSIPCPFPVHSLSPHIPNTLCAIDMSPYPKRTPYGAKRRRKAVPVWHPLRKAKFFPRVAVENNGCATEQYLSVSGGIGSSPKDILRSVALRNPVQGCRLPQSLQGGIKKVLNLV